jgi:hypothetical protein
MKHSKKQKQNRMMLLCATMATGGKVVVKDKFDNTIKESTITAIYADHTVELPDCIETIYNIFDVTIIRPLK